MIHSKQITAPLRIVKTFVDRGYKLSQALEMAAGLIERLAADRRGYAIHEVLAEAESLAEYEVPSDES